MARSFVTRQDHTTFRGQQRWFPFINRSSEAVPPHGVVSITTALIAADGGLLYYEGTKPIEPDSILAVNGPSKVAVDGPGEVTWDFPAMVAIEGGEEPTNFGEHLGIDHGQWKLRDQKAFGTEKLFGFRYLGVAIDTSGGKAGLFDAWHPTRVFATADDDITAGSDQLATIIDDEQYVTGSKIRVHLDQMHGDEGITSGKEIYAVWHPSTSETNRPGRWRIIGSECE